MLVGALALWAASMLPGQDIDLSIDLDNSGSLVIESYYQNATRTNGPIRYVGALATGEMVIFDSLGARAFNGTEWVGVEGLSRVEAALAVEGATIFAGVGGVFRATIADDGVIRAESLTAEIASADNGFALVSVAEARGRIFAARGMDLLVIDANGTIHRYALQGWSNGCFAIDGEVYFVGGDSTLLNRWDWENERLVPHDHVMEESGYEWISLFAPRSEGGVWMITSENNVFAFDGGRCWRWEGNDWLGENQVEVKCLASFGDGQLAVGTAGHGLLLFDRAGRLIRQVAQAHGLLDDRIDAVGADDQSGLWVATKRGVSRIDVGFEFELFDDRHGLVDAVTCLAMVADRLYLATPMGLYTPQESSESIDQLFERVNTMRNIGSLTVSGEWLHLGGDSWAAFNTVSGATTQLRERRVFGVWSPSRHKETVISADDEGIWVAQLEGGEWVQEGRVRGLSSSLSAFAETPDGSIWAEYGTGKVGRIWWEEGGFRGEEITLPNKGPHWTKLAVIEGELFVNHEPMLRWDPDAKQFVEQPEMIYYAGEPPYGFEQIFGRSGTEAYTVAAVSNAMAVRRPNRGVVGLVAHLGNAIDNRATSLLYDQQGRAWIAGAFGLALASDPFSSGRDQATPPRITALRDLGQGGRLPMFTESRGGLDLPYAKNSLRVEVAYRSFPSASENQYQIRLQGFDQDWPGWSSNNFREFTNLKPGPYVLEVVGMGADGIGSAIQTLAFSIRAPWYTTIWAYLVYGVAAMALSWLLLKVNARRLRAQNDELERVVAERTAELDAKAAELAEKNELLEHRGEELARTTESLASTLDQLRTAQRQLVEGARNAGKAEVASNVLHSVGNVLNSVNTCLLGIIQTVDRSKIGKLGQLAALVDDHRRDLERFVADDPRGKLLPDYLSRLSEALEAERKTLQAELGAMEGHVDSAIEAIAAQEGNARHRGLMLQESLRDLCEIAVERAFGDVASTLKIAVGYAVDAEHCVVVDRHRMLDILENLLSNAADAIAAGGVEGCIEMASALDADQGTIELKVRDNGCGFEPELRSQLFQRGFATKPDRRGFGLHDSANQAIAMGGSLRLESDGPGLGAVAILKLPAAM